MDNGHSVKALLIYPEFPGCPLTASFMTSHCSMERKKYPFSDIGPIQMTAEKTKTLPLPPLAGGIALVGGIVLLVIGSRRG